MNIPRRPLVLALGALALAPLAACSKKEDEAAAKPAARKPSGIEAYAIAQRGHGFTIGAVMAANTVYVFFDTFGIIDAVTNGGPAKATEILVYKVYYDGVHALNLGSSSAQSVILMAIVIVLTAVQFRYVERKVHY